MSLLNGIHKFIEVNYFDFFVKWTHLKNEKKYHNIDLTFLHNVITQILCVNQCWMLLVEAAAYWTALLWRMLDCKGCLKTKKKDCHFQLSSLFIGVEHSYLSGSTLSSCSVISWKKSEHKIEYLPVCRMHTNIDIEKFEKNEWT